MERQDQNPTPVERVEDPETVDEQAQRMHQELFPEKEPDAGMYDHELETWYKDKDIEIPLDRHRLVYDMQGYLGQARAFNWSTYH